MEISKRLEERGTRILGIGSALTDILIHESDAFVETLGYPKGGMTLVGPELSGKALGKTGARPEIVPGGATCNTIQGIARLGGDGWMVGKRGDDETGRVFEEDLLAAGVTPRLVKSATASGRVLSVITPDAQRTMMTCLGASEELAASDVVAEDLKGSAIVMLEGYLAFNPPLFRELCAMATASGAVVAMDLASFTVVDASRDLLLELVKDCVDILIANEDEAAAFAETKDEAAALSFMASLCEMAVLKLGGRGSRIAANGEIITVSAEGDAPIVDTTGAGDLWAAGFLFGLARGWSIACSGELGSACGYAVCREVGAQIPDSVWREIRNRFAI